MQAAPTAPRTLRQPKITKATSKALQTDQRKAQNHFLTLMLFQPPLRQYLRLITPEMLLDEPAQQLFGFLQAHPKFADDPQMTQELSSIADYVKILSLQFEELYQGLELLELRNEATRLQVRLIEQYVKTQKQPLTEAIRTADETEAHTLLEKVKKLDELLKRI